MSCNNDDNNRKRKKRSYLPVDDDQNEPNKRLNALQPPNMPAIGPVQPVSTPLMGSPTWSDFDSANPQIASPAVDTPQQAATSDFAATGSTDLGPQYPPSQAQSQPRMQYSQQKPQHVPQPVEYQPNLNTTLLPGFPNMGSADRQRVPRTELLKHQAIEASRFGSDGIPFEISDTGLPGKGHFVTAIPNWNMTIASCSGEKGRDTLNAQYNYHSMMGNQVEWTLISVPLLSPRLPDPHQPRQPSTSTENLVPTERRERRQTPGQVAPQTQVRAQASAQLLVQIAAETHPQGQLHLRCANCLREGHLVGDCVGPPSRRHGDLPACPICDTFAGQVEGTTGPCGHRFDVCDHVQGVLRRHRWAMDRQIAYPDLAALTDDELLMFFRALVVKRVRKVPIRTKLVCWIDILRETARRFRNTGVIVLANMTPWTKTFSIQQHNLNTPQAKPWEFYDYAVGNIQSLPMGPVEQVSVSLEDFVRDGLLGFPAQIFVSSDRR